MRVLILGASGMLGHKMWQVFRDRFETWATVRSNYEQYSKFNLFTSERLVGGVDAADFHTVVQVFETLRPHVVVNAIGIVKQLPVAKDPIVSIKINALLPHRLAALCKAINARLIHISTDCVFSGRKGMYTENDTPDADDLYGRSKLLGEVSESNCLTLRTSLVGRELESSRGLVEWFLTNRGGTVRGYTNAIFSGLPTPIMAEIIVGLIERYPNMTGIYHVSSEPISKYQLLCLLRDAYRISIEIEPYPDITVDRSLDATRFLATTGFALQPWTEMVQAMANDTTPYEVWRGPSVS